MQTCNVGVGKYVLESKESKGYDDPFDDRIQDGRQEGLDSDPKSTNGNNFCSKCSRPRIAKLGLRKICFQGQNVQQLCKYYLVTL